MALADADFAYRFDLGDVYVWIECNRKTCYAYLDGHETGQSGDCWLFNLVDAPGEFRPDRGEPPLLDRHHSRPFDLDREADPLGFLVTGGEFEGMRAYEIWYSDRLIGVLSPDRGQSQSAFASAPSSLVQPIDHSAALSRHFRRTESHVRRVLDLERGRLSPELENRIIEWLDHREYGLVLDELRTEESRLLPESLSEVAQVLLVKGEAAR
jgi:hypothetical protein